jgi:NAD+ synthase
VSIPDTSDSMAHRDMDSQEALTCAWAGFRIDAATKAREIEAFVRRETNRFGKRGVVIGLSGGLDSSTCAYLCVRALGARRVRGLILPERDSHRRSRLHAHQVAQRLGLRVEERDITPVLHEIGIYRPIPAGVAGNRSLLETGIRWISRLTHRISVYGWAMDLYYNQRPGLLARLVRRLFPRAVGSVFTFALTKPRVRMAMLYHAAAKDNAAVVGTLDRTEWSIGFYEPHGDGAADIHLLIHLYKTQIRELARFLGLPQEIVNKPSSGDLAAGLPNESIIGLSYEQLDRVLYGLHHGIAESEIRARAGVKRRAVNEIRRAMAVADLRRSLPSRLPCAEGLHLFPRR